LTRRTSTPNVNVDVDALSSFPENTFNITRATGSQPCSTVPRGITLLVI